MTFAISWNDENRDGQIQEFAMLDEALEVARKHYPYGSCELSSPSSYFILDAQGQHVGELVAL